MLWHWVQSVGNLADTCEGFVAVLYLAKWQLKQSLEVPVYPVEWHLIHSTAACPWVRGKLVLELWKKEDGFQAVCVWQIVQSVGNFALICDGLVVARNSGLWQLEHSFDVPTYPLEWHLMQSTPEWPPVKGKAVPVLWLKIEGFQADSV
jgi:hypothetical protein